MNTTRPAGKSPQGSEADSVPDLPQEVLSRIESEIHRVFLAVGDDVKAQLHQKLQEAAGLFENERTRFYREIHLLSQRVNTGRIEVEIARKALELVSLERELAVMIDDPDVEIARVIQHRSLLAELKAYIRGLRFQVEGSEKEAQES